MKKYIELLADRFLFMITAIVMIMLAWLFWSSSGQSTVFEAFILFAIILLIIENIHLRSRIKELKKDNKSE